MSSQLGAPAGAVNLVHAKVATGEALVRNPGVNFITFTGSTRAAGLAASHGVRLAGHAGRVQ